MLIEKHSTRPLQTMHLNIIIKNIIALILVFFVISCGKDTSEEQKSKSILLPALGNLKGVPVAIPVEYQFFAVNYEGESVWEGKKLKEKATLNTLIEQFVIRVRLPDMTPKTSENAADWQSHTFGSGDRFYPWIAVSVRSETHRLPPKLWDHAWLEKWGGYMFYDENCHYEKQNESRFDLMVEKLMCDESVIDKGNDRSRDVMYDGKRTIIVCNTEKLTSPNGRHICKHRFPIYEMNVIVEYGFYPEHLKDWNENQEKLTALLKNFVVDKSKLDLTQITNSAR